MKKYIVLICLSFVAVCARAQFDPQIGQYMYLQTAFNPAAVGENDMLRIAGMHRMQMTGITNAPMTTYFMVGSPFVIGKTKHGAGIRFLNDKYGLFTNQTLHIQYAYRHKIGKGYLSAGIEAGFVSVGFHGDSVNLQMLEGSEYHITSDQAIPFGEKSGMGFDLGAGIYYSAPTWYAGISYSHATQPAIEWTDSTTIHLRGTMYASGGYIWRLRANPQFKLQPSALLMSDFRGWDLTLAMLCEYNDKYRWGLSYRIMSNVAVILGMEIVSGLQIGYTYELPTTKLLLESYGSHELYLAYELDILRPKRTNKYRSVRFL